MVNQFVDYSHYYDLLYQDKNYEGEAEYVVEVLRSRGGRSNSILELGCGTGMHAKFLVESGCAVTGVELSETMFERALQTANSVKENGEVRFDPYVGDVRYFRAGRQFDAVISLFHVVSYQTANADVIAVFETASKHLNAGGLFLFDVWYGPAVLAQKPAIRVKRLKDSQVSLVRIAEPHSNFDKNTIDVEYTILITDEATGLGKQIHECHSMRYFFTPELEMYAGLHGMRIIHAEEWMTGNVPSEQTWGVTYVARKE